MSLTNGIWTTGEPAGGACLRVARGISDEVGITAATAYDLRNDPSAVGAPALGPPLQVAIQAITTPGLLKYNSMLPDGTNVDTSTVRTWTISATDIGDSRPFVARILASGSTFAGTLAVLW